MRRPLAIAGILALVVLGQAMPVERLNADALPASSQQPANAIGQRPADQAVVLEAQAAAARREGRWREAIEIFARAATLFDSANDQQLRSRAGNNWLGAANAATMANEWARAEDYAGRAIERLDGVRLATAQGPLSAFARTILAEAALNAGDYSRAWSVAGTAIAEVEQWEAANGAVFDLRQRYQDRARAVPNPREVRMLAGAMRFGNARRAEQIEIFEAFIQAGARARNSSLADAILLARQRSMAPPAKRALIDRLLSANARLDRARRAVAAGDPRGPAEFNAARALLDAVAAPALEAGIVLRTTRVSLAALRSALQPGEGFLFLYESPYGILIWGIDAQGEPFVNSNELTLKSTIASPGIEIAADVFRPLDRHLHYEMHRDFGRTLTAMSAALARNEQFTVASPQAGDPTRIPGGEALGYILRAEAMKIADSLLELRRRARWWTISFSDPIDGIPLAMLRYTKDDYFGTLFAYAIAPSIDAYLVQRQSVQPAPAKGFVGIGDIPFRRTPCSEWATPGGSFPTLYRDQRNWILGQPCLVGALEQLSNLASLGDPAIMLAGKDATEGSLRLLQGRQIGVLAFVTHAVAAEARTGGWPALLLYPPAKAAGSDDGRLLPSDAAELNIAADLVLLSACSTGAADEALGEEPLAGMARGFFLGGARSAVVTRWQIKFAVAGVMNRAFAAALVSGKSRAEAMLDARRAGKAVPGSQFWDWGAFELIGEGTPLRL